MIENLRNHYDTALLGVWYGSNYGSFLNGYSVYKLLKNMGYSVLMISKVGTNARDWELKDTHNVRLIKKIYDADEVSPFFSSENIGILNKYCDTFITGSDQIWNYGMFKSGLFKLDFVDDSKRKISFGTSFGHPDDFVPEEKIPYFKKLFSRFNAISVREQDGVKLCRDKYGVIAKKVIEPVFCLERKSYLELANSSSIREEEPYILAYILDPTPEKIDAIKYYSSVSGKKAIIIPDGDSRFIKKNIELINLPNIYDNIGADDFIKLIDGADFVFTDSFHGTAFSVIFNKPFLSVINRKRGAARFGDLLGQFKLTDRLFYKEQIPKEEPYLAEIDFSYTNTVIDEKKREAVDWLKNALETPIEKLPTVVLPDVSNAVTSILQKDMCTGCGACISVCPVSALVLRKDDFGYYRSDIDREKCINCGRCSKICPALNLPENKNNSDPACYAFYAADSDLLMQSSSGGAFSLLAQEAFRRDGAVVGAAWRDDFTVEHIIVKDPSDLYKLQKSKYMQSYTGSIDRDIKILLDQGKFVLFSGCPCQISGLKAYLKEDYANLILVDLLCGNAPSAAFFKKYLKDEFPDGIAEYEFRNKFNGWNSNCVAITPIGGTTIIRRGGEQDAYQAAYHSHTMTPHHCEKCRYQTLPRFGDITIGDFWGISKFDAKMRNTDGTSVVLCNNQKGQEFFDRIPTAEIGQKNKVPLEWVGSNGYMKKGAHNFASPNRDKFYSLINTMSFSDTMDYVIPKNTIPKYIKDGAMSPLHYDVAQFCFHFDNEIWDEGFIRGTTVLTVKSNTPPVGKYACLKLSSPLKEGNKYCFSIHFKIKSSATQYNFHVRESGTSHYQIIHSHKITAKNAVEWVELSINFIANSSLYDEFMVGASQLRGENSFLAIDYINITEIKS